MVIIATKVTESFTIIKQGYIVGYCSKGAFIQQLNTRSAGVNRGYGPVMYICRAGTAKGNMFAKPGTNSFEWNTGSITDKEVRELAAAQPAWADILKAYELLSTNEGHIEFDFNVSKIVF